MSRVTPGRVASGHAIPLRCAAVAVVVLAGGCVYYNGLYNAEVAFRRGEEARLRGDSDAAVESYQVAAEGAERAWRAEPGGEWAAPALLLAARAAVRTGDPRRARRELDALSRLARVDSASEARARVLSGAVLVLEQRPAAGLELLERERLDPEDSEWRAESWIWRARGLAALNRFDEAWAAFDFAAVHDRDLRWVVEAERGTHALAAERRVEASVGLEHLLTERRGEAWVDSVLVFTDRAERLWGPAVAAELIEPIRRDRWGPAARDRVLRRQVALLLAAGDTTRADETLAWIADGTTETAVTARIDLARLRIARATTFGELVPIRRVLLPVAEDPRARELVLAMSETELLSGWGVEGDVLAWFSAAEVARDELGAPALAGALFLTAAEADPDGRWTGKALLAALTVLGERGLRDGIRSRALARQFDPWVERLTRGQGASDEFRAREQELAARVRDLRVRAADEAARLSAIDPEPS